MRTGCHAAICTTLLAGCATPGPLHIYSAAGARPDIVSDSGPTAIERVPSFLAAGEELTGLAYDPFTDYLFLRLAPGNRIRVIDRPARNVKREFVLAEIPATGGGDLAVRPRDGHVFAALPGEAALVKFTRYGGYGGKIALGESAGTVRGVAFDAARDRLFILTDASATRVLVCAPDGRTLSVLKLDRTVAPGCLAYDSAQRELYAPLAGGTSVGVFGEDGRFRREFALRVPFFDVGPRSFLRIF